MEAFRFPLEKVLTWRGKVLDREEARLELLNAEVRRLERQLEELRESRIASGNRLRASSEISGSDLAALDSFDRFIDRAEQDSLARITAARGAVTTQQQVLVEARRSVRLLERLRERRLGEWKLEEAREYDNQAGESALVQWRRRN
jgi:flagellar export protein FliJ